MVRFLFFTYIIFLFFGAYSQTLSPGYKTNGKTNIEGFLNEINGLFYLVKSEYTNKNTYFVTLSAYDTATLKRDFEKRISINTKKGFVVRPLEILTLNDKIYFFYTELNTLTGDNILFANHMSYDGEKIWTREIDTVPHTFSSDKNLMIFVDINSEGLIIARKYGDGFENPNVLNVRAYDEDLIVRWEGNVQIPIQQKNLEFKQMIFDGDQKVYFLSEIIYNIDPYDKRNKILKGNRYHIWCYDHMNTKLKEFEVMLDERIITGMLMNLDQDNLEIFGSYTFPEDVLLRGTFSLKIDSDFKVFSSSLDPIPFSFYDYYDNERDSKRDLSNFYVQDLVTLENGHNILFLEVIYKTVSDYLDPRTNLYNYVETYHHNHILAFEYDDSCQMIQIHYLPKFQSSTIDDGYYSSFKTHVDKNEIWVFYNDNKNNEAYEFEEIDKYRPLINYRSLAIVALKYSNGKFSKAFSKSGYNYFYPKIIGGEVFKNSVYFHSEKGKKYQLIQIKLAE